MGLGITEFEEMLNSFSFVKKVCPKSLEKLNTGVLDCLKKGESFLTDVRFITSDNRPLDLRICGDYVRKETDSIDFIIKIRENDITNNF